MSVPSRTSFWLRFAHILDRRSQLDNKASRLVKPTMLALRPGISALCLTLVVVCLCCSSSVRAEDSSADWDGGYAVKSERRSDVVFGIDYGPALGRISGYRNDAIEVGDPRFKADTGTAVGQTGRLWLGGALRDWFTFGLGAELLSVEGNGLRVRGGSFIMRTEFYPLFWKGGTLRDLGVALDVGLGTLMGREESGRLRIDGGSPAHLGVGVFHETLRWHGFVLGPTIAYSTYFGETVDAHIGQLGIRGAFYTGP